MRAMSTTGRLFLLRVLLGAFVGSAYGDAALHHYYRGIDKAGKNGLGGAIAEYTKAIELKPDYHP